LLNTEGIFLCKQRMAMSVSLTFSTQNCPLSYTSLA
jgi:hypothetical protein